MAKRKIIKIDGKKCNGCSLCIPNCPEGAIQVIDGKARLISDLFCDGLGACLGHCPQGAITIVEREAQTYDERKVMANIVTHGPNTITAHLRHLKEHGEVKLLKEAIAYLKEKKISVDFEQQAQKTPCGHGTASAFGGCPGSKIMDFRKKQDGLSKPAVAGSQKADSELRQWPVQLTLVSPMASYLQDSDLLIAADCVPFAYAGFHQDLLKGKMLLVGCPKLDDTQAYQKKLEQIFTHNTIKSVTYAHMEVPCCFGLTGVIESAIAESGKKIPLKEITISIQGEKING